MNRDLINNANPADVARGSISIIDAMQNMQPHVQMHAAAAVFLALSEHWGIPATEAFNTTKNLMNDQDGKRPEFRAVAMYMANEL